MIIFLKKYKGVLFFRENIDPDTLFEAVKKEGIASVSYFPVDPNIFFKVKLFFIFNHIVRGISCK